MTSLVRKIPGQFHDEHDGQDYVLSTEWWFSSTDPAAVVLRCPQPHAEIREWYFARILLAHGLHTAAGLALTRVEPCACGGHVEVTASFDTALVVVRFPMAAVAAFLLASTQLVPLGEIAEEGAYTDELAAGVKDCLEDWPR